MQGFSLLEFLIASALSIIVLLAVTSGYLTARTLNHAATQRLSTQQDLRNAAAQIVRDARMAGNFGCFSMAKHKPENVLNDAPADSPFRLIGQTAQEKLIPLREIESLGINGFSQRGNALLFQYGIDNTAPAAALAIVSNCSAISKTGTVISSKEAARNALSIPATDSSSDASISVMQHVVHAYAVGSFGDGADQREGLYRFQLDSSGSWGTPQLLIKNVSGMDITYLYPASGSCSGDAPVPSFKYTSDDLLLDTAGATLPTTSPAMIQLVLNGRSITAGDENQVHAYTINAAVRGGNLCADRSI